MSRFVRAFAVAFVSIISVNAFAQSCDLSGGTTMTCDSPISLGSSSQCTLTIKNAGTADCVGNWTMTLGSFDPGTFSDVQSNLVDCTFVAEVQLTATILNQMVLHSAFGCLILTSLRPGLTFSMNRRVTPAYSITEYLFVAG